MRRTAGLLLTLLLGTSTSAADGFVTVSDGARIHYLERTPARRSSELALVFVPGWMMPATIWEAQLRRFGSAYRVLALDPRSQGESTKMTEGNYPAQRARDLREVLEKRNAQRVVLIAVSSGVTDVAAYVDQFGTDRIAGLVLVHGVAGAHYDSQAVLGLVRWAQRFQVDRKAQTESFVRSLFVRRDPPAADVVRLTTAAMKMPTNCAMAAFLGSLAADYRPALAKIDRPTLIIVGDSTWHGQYETMQRSIAGARLERIDGAGHAVYIEAADRFDALLTEFVTDLDRR